PASTSPGPPPPRRTARRPPVPQRAAPIPPPGTDPSCARGRTAGRAGAPGGVRYPRAERSREGSHVRSASDVTVRSRAAAMLGALVLGAGLAACSDSEEPETAPPPRTTHGPTGSAAPAPPPTHPFTGERKGLNNPVLAVKIENTRPALPQSGVKAADIVYVEQVEGGETRLMAVYSSELPRRVGPVRS